MYGFYLIITRKLSSSDNPLLTLLLTGVVGAIIIFLTMPIVWVEPSFTQWSLMVAVGYFCLHGTFLFNFLIKYADASKLAPLDTSKLLPI